MGLLIELITEVHIMGTTQKKAKTTIRLAGQEMAPKRAFKLIAQSLAGRHRIQPEALEKILGQEFAAMDILVGRATAASFLEKVCGFIQKQQNVVGVLSVEGLVSGAVAHTMEKQPEAASAIRRIRSALRAPSGPA